MKINYSKLSFIKLTCSSLIYIILILLTSSSALQAQHIFYPGEIMRLEGFALGFNIEVYDINNDKKPDIISGNFNNTSVFYGGTGVLDNKADLFYRGRCVAITDYNGDGHKDMIALHFTDTVLYNDYKGEFLFYWGSQDGQFSIDTTADYSIPLPIERPYTKRLCTGQYETATRTGDLNHDGKGDLIFGTSYSVSGQIIIYLGREVPCDTPDFNVSPKNNREVNFGDYYDVADINGDHYDDLAMTSRILRQNSGQDSACNFYVFYGSDNFRCSLDSPSVKYTCRVISSYRSTGWINQSFSFDDINGDNLTDIVVGNYPKMYFYYGKPSGVIDTIPSFVLTDPDTTDKSIGIGGSTQNIGDYNHDGYNDFLIPEVGWKTFGLLLGGPHVSNKNPFGIRGELEANYSYFPNKALPAGYQDPTGDLYPDFICNAKPRTNKEWGTILVFVGDNHQIISDVSEEVSNTESFNLNQNYPNPFNSSTTVSFTLSREILMKNSDLRFTIYDMLGKEVYSEVNSYTVPGSYQIKVDAGKLNLSSGTYFYQIRGHNFKSTKKMIYLK